MREAIAAGLNEDQSLVYCRRIFHGLSKVSDKRLREYYHLTQTT